MKTIGIYKQLIFWSYAQNEWISLEIVHVTSFLITKS